MFVAIYIFEGFATNSQILMLVGFVTLLDWIHYL